MKLPGAKEAVTKHSAQRTDSTYGSQAASGLKSPETWPRRPSFRTPLVEISPAPTLAAEATPCRRGQHRHACFLKGMGEGGIQCAVSREPADQAGAGRAVRAPGRLQEGGLGGVERWAGEASRHRRPARGEVRRGAREASAGLRRRLPAGACRSLDLGRRPPDLLRPPTNGRRMGTHRQGLLARRGQVRAKRDDCMVGCVDGPMVFRHPSVHPTPALSAYRTRRMRTP